MNNIESLEKNQQWTTTLIEALEKDIEQQGSAESYIHLLFVCWYLVLEKGAADVRHDIPDNLLIEKVKHYYNEGLKLFSGNDRFCFYSGWMLSISEWYFGVNDANLGKDFLLKAHHLKPDNPLYKWACKDILKLSNKDVLQVIEQIDDNEFDRLGFLIKDYFKKLIGYTKKELYAQNNRK